MKNRSREDIEKFLSSNGKVRRVDFWNFVGSTTHAEEILYDLFLEGKIIFDKESDRNHTFIIYKK
jgi:hypothetical protein